MPILPYLPLLGPGTSSLGYLLKETLSVQCSGSHLGIVVVILVQVQGGTYTYDKITIKGMSRVLRLAALPMLVNRVDGP